MRERLQCAAVGLGLAPLALRFTRYAVRCWVLRHLCPLGYPLPQLQRLVQRNLPHADVIQPWLHDDDLNGLDVVEVSVACVCAQRIQHPLHVAVRLDPMALTEFEINHTQLGVVEHNRVGGAKTIRHPLAEVHALLIHLLPTQLPHDIHVHLHRLCHLRRHGVGVVLYQRHADHRKAVRPAHQRYLPQLMRGGALLGERAGDVRYSLFGLYATGACEPTVCA